MTFVPRTSNLDIDGQLVRVAVTAGGRKGVPVLLFNAIGSDLESWAPFASRIEDTETISFDVPGIGGSPLPKMPYRPAWLASLVAGLLDQLGYDEVDVLGFSWGGFIAQQFAIQFPKRCRKLVLAATATGMFAVPWTVSVMAKLADPRCFFDPAHVSTVASEIFGGTMGSMRELFKEYARCAVPQTDPRGVYYQLLATAGWSSAFWLPALTQSTLILSGSKDPIASVVHGRILNSLIRNSRFHIVEDGHLFLSSSPTHSANLVQSFLKEGTQAIG